MLSLIIGVGLILLGVGIFVYGVDDIHRYMEKENRIDDLTVYTAWE